MGKIMCCVLNAWAAKFVSAYVLATRPWLQNTQRKAGKVHLSLVPSMLSVETSYLWWHLSKSWRASQSMPFLTMFFSGYFQSCWSSFCLFELEITVRLKYLKWSALFFGNILKEHVNCGDVCLMCVFSSRTIHLQNIS